MKNLLIGLLLLAQGATQSGTGGGAGLTLRGRVINDSAIPSPTSGGQGIGSLGVYLTSTVREAGSRTYSVSERTFSFSQIPIGIYSVEIQNLPEGYSVKSVTAGTSNLLWEKLGLTASDPPKVSITLSVSSRPR